MHPQTKRQYFGNFQYKNWIEHVVVETLGETITRILVSTTIDGARTELWFTLEAYNPELNPETDQSHRYDESNKLHFKALFLVYQTLMTEGEDNPKKRQWHASIMQTWPADARLEEEPYAEKSS